MQDPYARQKALSKQLLKDARAGKISKTKYLEYYYNIPFRLRSKYGVPKVAPKFIDARGRY
jgi:hypothetical protein